jgi:hypothetical protein
LAADQSVADAAFTFLAMASRALLREYVASVSNTATAGWKTAAIASDIDVPSGDLGRRRGAPDTVHALCGCTCQGQQ